MLAEFLAMAWRTFRVWTQWFLRRMHRQWKAAPPPPVPVTAPAYRIKKPAPGAHWRRKPTWVPVEIVRLKDAAPALGGEKIAASFNRLHAHARQVTVGKTYVCEVLRRHRYELEQLRERCKHRVPAPVGRNGTWAFDMTGKGDEQSNIITIAGLIDHGTRRALVLKPIAERSAVDLLKVISEAVEQFGRPRALRTDNEAVFRSPVFEAGLKLLGIRHQFTQPGKPWQNGIVEKLFGTLKEKLDQLVVPNIHALTQALATFRVWYNEVRPHNHLNGLTPNEVWDEVNPYRIAPRRIDLFNEWEGLLQGFAIRR